MVGPLRDVPRGRDHQLRREHRHRPGGHAGAAARPSWPSVPRLYEKIYARVLDSVRASSASSRRIFGWARRVGETWAELSLARTRRCPPALRFSDALARPPGVREAAGPHRRPHPVLRFGRRAALAPEIAQFFYAAGMPILEGYGLTETSPVIAVNTFEPPQARHRGPADPRRRGPDRAGRRDPDPRPARDEGLLQQAGGDRGGDRPGGLVSHRRHRRARRGRLPPDHRPEEGPHRHRRREEHRAAADREPRQDQQVRLERGDARRPPAVPHHARRPEYRSAQGVGGAPAHRGERPSRLLALPEVRTKLEREVRKTLRDLAQFEMPKKLLLLPQRIQRGNRRADADAQGEASQVVEERHREAIESLYAEPHAT